MNRKTFLLSLGTLAASPWAAKALISQTSTSKSDYFSCVPQDKYVLYGPVTFYLVTSKLNKTELFGASCVSGSYGIVTGGDLTPIHFIAKIKDEKVVFEFGEYEHFNGNPPRKEYDNIKHSTKREICFYVLLYKFRSGLISNMSLKQ